MFTLQKENLHHAYLVARETSILERFLDGLVDIGFVVQNNPDVITKHVETFTIDDAREIKVFQSEKPVMGDRKIIVIVAEYLSHQSQHALLKVFEEPATGVHFFLITPVIAILLPTLRSRLIDLEIQKEESSSKEIQKQVEEFIASEKEDRLLIIGQIIKKFEKEETSISLKVYAVSFINELEQSLSKRDDKHLFDISLLWKVKDYLHDQGASVKNLLELLALTL